MSGYPDDPQFKDRLVTEVTGAPDHGWSVTTEDGWSFFVPAGDVMPIVGGTVRLYGRGIGYLFRGMFLDGQCVFYRTVEEEEEHRDIESYGRDAADLLARWDDGRSVWSIELGGFGPGYEQAIQITAFEVLRCLLAERPDATAWVNDTEWRKTRDKLNDTIMPIVDPLGLSGSQWGAAVGLAARLYRDGPREMMKSAPDDRRIQVRRNFPSLAA